MVGLSGTLETKPAGMSEQKMSSQENEHESQPAQSREATDTPSANLIKFTVQHGKNAHEIEFSATRTVGELKKQLEQV